MEKALTIKGEKTMTKGNLKPDVYRIIELLFSKYFRKHEGLIELRFISKNTGLPISTFYQYSDINDDVIKDIQRLNINHHVYFGVNPRQLSRKKKQVDIKNSVCLWVDIDQKDFEAGKKGAFKSIENFSPKPNIIVDSSNGYHCYWILKEPITDIIGLHI